MEAAVEVKFATKPIPAPGASHTRYLSGRLTYYGAAEIVEPAATASSHGPAAAAAAAISIRTNDVVTVSSVNQGGYPFLAQVCCETFCVKNYS